MMRRPPTYVLLLVSLLLQAFVQAGLSAQVVTGRLTDLEAGTPIALGRVTLLDADGIALRITLTDTEGYYLLWAPGPGDYWLKAESEFYEALSDGPISLMAADTMWLDYRVEPRPVELDRLTVTAKSRSPRLEREGVYERMEARIGRHFDAEQLRAYRNNPVSNVLKLLPMIELRPDTMFPGAAVSVLFRRRQFPSPRGDDGASTQSACYPQVFLNGIIMSPGGEFPSGLDHFLSDNLSAIEVYEDPAFLPGRFHGHYASCGTIVLWSR